MTCPTCATEFATDITPVGRSPAAPSVGSVAVCAHCTAVMVFVREAEGLGVRLLADDQIPADARALVDSFYQEFLAEVGGARS